MRRLGVEGRPGAPKEFADFIAEEAPKWAQIVAASGVTVN
jgi:hypothetical protein